MKPRTHLLAKWSRLYHSCASARQASEGSSFMSEGEDLKRCSYCPDMLISAMVPD